MRRLCNANSASLLSRKKRKKIMEPVCVFTVGQVVNKARFNEVKTTELIQSAVFHKTKVLEKDGFGMDQ